MNLGAALAVVAMGLRIGFFLLMAFGLTVSSIMLYLGKINGAEWVTLCSVLFGVDRFGHALSEIGGRKNAGGTS